MLLTLAIHSKILVKFSLIILIVFTNFTQWPLIVCYFADTGINDKYTCLPGLVRADAATMDHMVMRSRANPAVLLTSTANVGSKLFDLFSWLIAALHLFYSAGSYSRTYKLV